MRRAWSVSDTWPSGFTVQDQLLDHLVAGTVPAGGRAATSPVLSGRWRLAEPERDDHGQGTRCPASGPRRVTRPSRRGRSAVSTTDQQAKQNTATGHHTVQTYGRVSITKDHGVTTVIAGDATVTHLHADCTTARPSNAQSCERVSDTWPAASRRPAARYLVAGDGCTPGTRRQHSPVRSGRWRRRSDVTITVK
jgi:hypothetical protein